MRTGHEASLPKTHTNPTETEKEDRPNGDKGGPRVNGHTNGDVLVERQVSSDIVYEERRSSNGESLATIRTDGAEDDISKAVRRDARTRQVRSELVSGRKAGENWDRRIRWAPLNVPLKRRLQTLMVLLHSLSIIMMVTTFFFLCAIPLLWPIIVPYLIYVLLSNAGSSGEHYYRSERIRRLPIWSLFASYFPARLHRSHVLPPTRKYIFGYHPHGIISHGAFAAFATEAMGFSQLFPGITNSLLTLDSNFRIPIYRDWALRLGMASVSRESCENLLSKGGVNSHGMGRAITIVIGGASESLDAEPGIVRLVLARRRGFVKLAIRTGADLVPVFAFGENDLYEQVRPADHPLLHQFQMLVKKILGFTVPIFHARGIFNYDVGILPYRRPVNVVVGKPIQVRQQEKPDEAYVQELHDEYTQELRRIWDDWKDTFYKDRDAELQIVS
ncbi:DAGAT-domain-containing protein [Eremomyces bilateralis CBS 781.70]|uniref:Diacylglycerol O-acyltransferase n=1 Tax=Eremomyces bilateralis CBS 781.70 TaxID=1392243 RepID=A0A6G1GCJ9_9PEZI|nr:DAGAT-domain-containing protein [Eremomyces bilateralis CBS 781.70]KAF1815818.1 DAGAT-domain-containing protein [Eremomyces bilateralis CBS 781.70]